MFLVTANLVSVSVEVPEVNSRKLDHRFIVSVEVPSVNSGKSDQRFIISVEVPSVNSGYSDQRFIITCMSCRRMPAVIMTNAGLKNIFIFM